MMIWDSGDIVSERLVGLGRCGLTREDGKEEVRGSIGIELKRNIWLNRGHVHSSSCSSCPGHDCWQFSYLSELAVAQISVFLGWIFAIFIQ